MTNPSYSTVQEQMLQNELIRIRSTYSFRLGLLLTDSIVRKPWLLPLLPFTFIKMNIDFLKDRKRLNKISTKVEYEVEQNCLLLFPTSEEGLSGVERAKSIAIEWINYGRKVVIISTSELMEGNIPEGVMFYPLSDPKNIPKEERTVWNEKCANMIGNVIELHRPISVVFDGPYPYRGLINTISVKPNVVWTWLRVEESPENMMNEHLGYFDLTYFGSASEIFSNQNERVEVNSNHSNKVLLALDYDKKAIKNWNKYSSLIKKLNEKKVEFVIPSHSTIGSSLLVTSETWSSISTSSRLSTLFAAIIGYDLFLVSKLMSYGIPTICIVDEESNNIADKLKFESVNYPLIVLDSGNNSELDLALSTILNNQSNEAMRKMPIYISSMNWSSLFGQIHSLSE